jgi:hypothetical protein
MGSAAPGLLDAPPATALDGAGSGALDAVSGAGSLGGSSSAGGTDRGLDDAGAAPATDGALGGTSGLAAIRKGRGSTGTGARGGGGTSGTTLLASSLAAGVASRVATGRSQDDSDDVSTRGATSIPAGDVDATGRVAPGTAVGRERGRAAGGPATSTRSLAATTGSTRST